MSPLLPRIHGTSTGTTIDERAGIIYISGPMSGHPGLNEPAFRAAEQTIWASGAEPLTPHDIMPHTHPGTCPPIYSDGHPGDHDSGCHLRGDLAAMLDEATSLYVLPGWSRSRGAQIEVLIARLLRIPIDYHPDAERGGSAVEVLADVYDEINRQNAKWGDQSHPDGTQRPEDNDLANYTQSETQTAFAEGRGTWRHILAEEVAEAYAETGAELSTELVQVAAVAVQWRAAQARRNQPRKENPDEPQD